MSICIDEFHNAFGLVQFGGIYIIRVPSDKIPFDKSMKLCDDLQKSFSAISKQKVVFIPDSKCKRMDSEFFDDNCSHIIDLNLPPFPSAKREKVAVMLKSRIRKVDRKLKFIVYVNQ